jgi:hypothetical protein
MKRLHRRVHLLVGVLALAFFMANSQIGRPFNLFQWNCRTIKEKKRFLHYKGHGSKRREVKIGIKNVIEFKKTLELGTETCELVGAEILIDHGQKVNVFSVYCTPGWGLNSREVGDALAVVSWFWVISTLTASLVTQKTVVRVRSRVCSMDLTWSILMTEH